MKILALDTSTDFLSLAVIDGETTAGRFHRRIGRNHSSLLVPSISSLLKRCRIPPAALDGFCISIGPGSFTGLRIGVATVKGLSLSLDKPIVAVPTLDAIAHNADKLAQVVCPVLDARKGKVYACLYKRDGGRLKALTKFLLVTAEELARIAGGHNAVSFLGDGAGLIEKGAAPGDWYPRAEVVGRLGYEDFEKKRFVSAEELEPLYLYSRECDIKGI